MLTKLFTLIKLILTLLGLWEGFLKMVEAERTAKEDAKDKARDVAIDDQKKAQSEKDYDDAQKRIAGNLP